MEWWEFPEEELVPVRPDPKPLVRSRADRIAEIEEEVHVEAATVINDAMHFMAIEPGQIDVNTGDEMPPQIPEEWIRELGQKGAERRMRTAQMANLPAKEAPIGLRLAKDTLVGMSKAKAQRNQPARTLNMVVVNMAGPLPQFDELEVNK